MPCHATDDTRKRHLTSVHSLLLVLALGLVAPTLGCASKSTDHDSGGASAPSDPLGNDRPGSGNSGSSEDGANEAGNSAPDTATSSPENRSGGIAGGGSCTGNCGQLCDGGWCLDVRWVDRWQTDGVEQTPSLTLDSDGNALVSAAATHDTRVGGELVSAGSLVAAQYDQQGSVTAKWVYPAETRGAQWSHHLALPGGDLLLAGRIRTNTTIGDQSFDAGAHGALVVLRLRSDNTVRWSKTHLMWEHELGSITGITYSSIDASAYLTIKSRNTDSLFSGGPATAGNDDGLFVLKLDASNGHELWNALIFPDVRHPAFHRTWPHNMATTADGGLLIACSGVLRDRLFLRAAPSTGAHIDVANAGREATYLVKIHPNGTAIELLREFPDLRTPAIATLPDGSILLAGGVRSAQSLKSYPALVKLAADGTPLQEHVFGSAIGEFRDISVRDAEVWLAGLLREETALLPGTELAPYGGLVATANSDLELQHAVSFDFGRPLSIEATANGAVIELEGQTADLGPGFAWAANNRFVAGLEVSP